MKQYHPILVSIILTILLFLFATPSPVHSQTPRPVVRAVLFYSPTCPHCHKVISEVLPPLFEKYGSQLEMMGVDISQQSGQALYLAAIQRFTIPEERMGVPTLIVGEVVLVGSLEIPENFPGWIEAYLSQGGVDWPDIPGLREALARGVQTEETSTPSPPSTASPAGSGLVSTTATVPLPTATPGPFLPEGDDSNWRENFARDPAGNTLSVLVLAGMFASIAWAVTLFKKTDGISFTGDWAWSIPILCAVGFGVAGYLAYVETAQVTAICGPVGDCNTVQQSEYARLFGILPIGVLGLFGYAAIVIAWCVARNANGRLADLAAVSLLAMTAFGALFSIYLTYLEPFVIGATCAWCLTSAILMTILMSLAVRPAKAAFSRLALLRSLYRDHTRIGVHDD